MSEVPATTLETIALARPPAAAPAAAVTAPALTDVFGQPPLLRGEDANLYDALFARVVAAARPRDVFEWILLKDYADLAWDVFRLRRAKTGLVNGEQRRAVIMLLQKCGLPLGLGDQWHSNPDFKASVLKRLADGGIDEEVVAAEAIVGACQRLGWLDAMIVSAETRRSAMLRELDHHRAGLGSRLRAMPDVIDAETEDAPAATSAEPQPA
jgi:hypothetical protein